MRSPVRTVYIYFIPIFLDLDSLRWARCAQIINHMADAIIPVPIYDPQYQQLTNLVLNAKKIITINSKLNTSNGSQFEIGSFNIAIITQLYAKDEYTSTIYYQISPITIIIPNMSSVILPTIVSPSGAAESCVKISTTDHNITIATNISGNNPMASCLIAILE